MAKNNLYLALGEEAQRGTKQSTTVGFLPLNNPSIPKMEFNDKPVAEFRGQDSILGPTLVRRFDRKWTASLEMPVFTEAGTVAGMMGTLLKHFFGHVNSVQNGATGQYVHMMSPSADHFATAELGTKALTVNLNINEGSVMKNWPFVGGRVKGLTFTQETGSELVLGADMFGQFRDAVTAELGNPAFPAENLVCKYNNLTVYTGTITRVGTAPNYTDLTFASATALKPDKITLTLENGFEDVLRLSGVDYPDKTRTSGQIKATLEMTLDWEDPASGFSSVTDFNAWVAAAGATNFALVWDTGTQAGTGDNHSLIIDLPNMERQGGSPDYALDKDPMVTLKYEGLLDNATTQYMVGLMLKNTAAAV